MSKKNIQRIKDSNLKSEVIDRVYFYTYDAVDDKYDSSFLKATTLSSKLLIPKHRKHQELAALGE